MLLLKKCNFEANSIVPQIHTDGERYHSSGTAWVIFQLSHTKKRATDKLEGVRGGD